MNDTVTTIQGHEVPQAEANFSERLDYNRISDFLGIQTEDRRDKKLADKLSFIVDWAKDSGAESDNQVKNSIHSLARSLGIERQGRELVDKLHIYLRLDQDRRRIENKMHSALE